jgi:hypothetical protein
MLLDYLSTEESSIEGMGVIPYGARVVEFAVLLPCPLFCPRILGVGRDPVVVDPVPTYQPDP